MKRKLVISCHADTGFRSHRLRIGKSGEYVGHLDNFIGVHAVMKAYFSGKLDHDNVRIELTYGEETGMDGAREVLPTLSKNDVVAVVDVTGAETKADITIEKCDSKAMQKFVRKALKGLSYELFEDCPDPVSDCDESDVYRERLRDVFFLGIPCRGGDYNAGMVRASPRSAETASRAIVRLARVFAGKNG